MISPFKKVLLIFIFNLSLFILLMIGIQNSLNKRKLNLILGETIKLPISFIIGVSFIGGSLTGSVLATNLENKS